MFKKITLIIGLFLLLGIPIFLYTQIQKDSPSVLGSDTEMEAVQIGISPSLNFALFDPYTVSALNVPPTPSNVTLNLSVDMGDDNECWDFFIDGTCSSEPISLNMTYDEPSNSYKKTIYPDQIYPEIFFAPSDITWGNTPLDTPVRRNDYHIFHFVNNFEMVGDMNLWVEFNSVPVSQVNSADLQVYVVENGHDITYFNQDWMGALGTEMIGTISKTASFDHTHSANSSHHLIRLATDSNGYVGNKALDVSDDFWIVLYSNSPNTNRGWNLRYQPESLCDNSSNWYRGDRSGWSTTHQQGCPDAHIHISRRNILTQDFVNAYVSATYDNGTFSSPVTTFEFTPLPNLPPNSTSFISPIVGTTYRGNLNIQWDPATDPNTSDTLTYTIYLTKTGETPVTLVTGTTETTYTLNTDVPEITDGEYTVTGQVCDNLGLCTNFGMDGIFHIDNIFIPETVSTVTISSSNINTSLAKDGDTVSITMLASGTISQPTVDIYSGGNDISDTVSVINTEGNTWIASYQVSSLDTDGGISFEIYSDNLDRIYYSTTNQSGVTVDTTVPISPVSSLESDTYTGVQTLTLTSSLDAYIKYVLNEESVSCSTGTLYQEPLEISEETTLKAIACDSAGNVSPISTYTYSILFSISSIAISSSNSNTSYAKIGDTVTLSFTTTHSISTPTVSLTVGETELTEGISLTSTDNVNWITQYIVLENDTNGLISFSISSPNLYTTFTETTDLSRVSIDTQVPITPISNIPTGTYPTSQTISLTSESLSLIRYTVDSSIPTCTTGNTYLLPFTISSSKIIKAVSCDLASNQSSLLTLSISIFPDTLTLDTSPQPEEQLPLEEDENIIQEILEIKKEESIEENDIQSVIPIFKIRILDKEYNPIPHLSVTINSKPQTTKTDINGIAIFTNIPFGTHTLIYSYNDNQYSQNITADEEYIKENNMVEILDVVTLEKTNINTYLIPIGIFVLIVLIFLILRRVLKKEKVIDKEEVSL